MLSIESLEPAFEGCAHFRRGRIAFKTDNAERQSVFIGWLCPCATSGHATDPVMKSSLHVPSGGSGPSQVQTYHIASRRPENRRVLRFDLTFGSWADAPIRSLTRRVYLNNRTRSPAVGATGDRPGTRTRDRASEAEPAQDLGPVQILREEARGADAVAAIVKPKKKGIKKGRR